jgi:hypothetical protein
MIYWKCDKWHGFVADEYYKRINKFGKHTTFIFYDKDHIMNHIEIDHFIFDNTVKFSEVYEKDFNNELIKVDLKYIERYTP